MENFITISENVTKELIEKKSKFIANIFYIETIEEGEELIKKIQKKYFDARHNCFAYRIITSKGVYEKSSDDGEPSGTAGAPMLNILQKNNISNILVIVTRYFGGILLGTGGLVRAYSDSLLLALEKAKKIQKCVGEILQIEVGYNNFEKFKYCCNKEEVNIIESEFLENIACKIEIEEDKKEKFLQELDKKGVNLKKKEFLTKKIITKN